MKYVVQNMFFFLTCVSSLGAMSGPHTDGFAQLPPAEIHDIGLYVDIVSIETAQTNALSDANYNYPELMKEKPDHCMSIINEALALALIDNDGDEEDEVAHYSLTRMFRYINNHIKPLEILRRQSSIEQKEKSSPSLAPLETPCGHFFHRSCIRKALEYTGKCPACQTALTYITFKKNYRRPKTLADEQCTICLCQFHQEPETGTRKRSFDAENIAEKLRNQQRQLRRRHNQIAL